jgi:hypothetical protein
MFGPVITLASPSFSEKSISKGTYASSLSISTCLSVATGVGNSPWDVDLDEYVVLASRRKSVYSIPMRQRLGQATSSSRSLPAVSRPTKTRGARICLIETRRMLGERSRPASPCAVRALAFCTISHGAKKKSIREPYIRSTSGVW